MKYRGLKEDRKLLMKFRRKLVTKCYWFPKLLQKIQQNGNWVKEVGEVEILGSVVKIWYKIFQTKQEKLVKSFYERQFGHFVGEDWAESLRDELNKTQLDAFGEFGRRRM